MKIETETTQKAAKIVLERDETLIIMSKKNKAYFLQVIVDECDDLLFDKRENNLVGQDDR